MRDCASSSILFEVLDVKDCAALHADADAADESKAAQ
jgi:hypothetical protein